MKPIPSLSIFFPAYNDARTISSLINKALRVAKRVTKRYEIIVVNDGSTDETARVVKKLTDRHIRLISHEKNQGYGTALQTGFAAAKYDWVFYTDGDGQYDPSELVILVTRLSNDIDVVNGYKTNRADSWVRTALGFLYNWYLHRIYRLPIRDVDCDFRLIRRSLLQHMHLTSTSGTICLELVRKLDSAGARFAQVPVHHYPRRFGRSQFFQMKHLGTTLREFWKQAQV